MPRSSTDNDKLIGRQIRLARQSRGLSQEGLANAIGVTFQQVQKYEKGTNRISAGRLVDVASFLGLDINYFFGPAFELQSDQKQVELSSRVLSKAAQAAAEKLDTLNSGVRSSILKVIDELHKSDVLGAGAEGLAIDPTKLGDVDEDAHPLSC